MSTLKVNSDLLLEAANRFLKMAQGFGMQTSADPMKKALDQAFGKQIGAAVGAAFEKSISSVEIHIDFSPETKTAKFTLYGNGTDEDKAELTTYLNNNFAAKAYPIMAKFQKTPMDYKYGLYEK
jgi:hypothetical protein